jgi:hypothetical protein
MTPIRGGHLRPSKVTSGRRLFVIGDGRSAWTRRWNDLILAHVSDLGGPETLSEKPFVISAVMLGGTGSTIRLTTASAHESIRSCLGGEASQ